MTQRQGLFRNTVNAEQAVVAYCEIASRYGITPSQLALAWCDQVDGVSSTIIGATTMEQLQENMAAFDVQLSPDCINDVMAVLQKYTMPF
jgi:aryl-alcohol dehydrogenase-like predicted oxidoreductase